MSFFSTNVIGKTLIYVELLILQSSWSFKLGFSFYVLDPGRKIVQLRSSHCYNI